MNPTLNNEAPAAPMANMQDYVRLPAFPRSDSYVLTVVGTNYIASHPFNRKDDEGRESTVMAPAVELYFGGEVDGKPYFAKTWPQKYSWHEKSNLSKWYTAITGKSPDPVSARPKDLVGKPALVEIKVEKKKGAKSGKEYTATNVGTVAKVPSILAATATPLAKLEAPFAAALAASSEKRDGNGGGDVPF